MVKICCLPGERAVVADSLCYSRADFRVDEVDGTQYVFANGGGLAYTVTVNDSGAAAEGQGESICIAILVVCVCVWIRSCVVFILFVWLRAAIQIHGQY